MRKSFWIIPILSLFVAISAVSARADIVDGTFNFTVTSGATPTGSFVYDTTLQEFTSFAITWDGLTFAYALPYSDGGSVYNALPTTGVGDVWCGVGPDATGESCIPNESDEGTVGDLVVNQFYLFTADNGPFQAIPMTGGSATDDDAFAYGTYTVTESPVVPEPGTSSLMLIGVAIFGLVLLARNRISRVTNKSLGHIALYHLPRTSKYPTRYQRAEPMAPMRHWP